MKRIYYLYPQKKRGGCRRPNGQRNQRFFFRASAVEGYACPANFYRLRHSEKEAFLFMVDKTLSDMAVELSDAEKERLFGSLPLSQQADVANLLWKCESPEQRQSVYGVMREWWQAMTVGIN